MYSKLYRDDLQVREMVDMFIHLFLSLSAVGLAIFMVALCFALIQGQRTKGSIRNMKVGVGMFMSNVFLILLTAAWFFP